MSRVVIEHIISPTLKEIYEFERQGDVWKYVGICWSRRNGENDIWGDELGAFYSEQKVKELTELVRKHGYKDLDEYYDCAPEYSRTLDDEFSDIVDKFSPTMTKTLSGMPYRSGVYFSNKPKTPDQLPKISDEEIKAKILEKISNVKIKL